MREPRGVWQYLWDYRGIPEDVDGVVRRLQATGCAGVIVKTSDGEWDWTGRNKVAELVSACHAAGIGCAGFWYSVGDWQGPAIGFEGGDAHSCTIAAELDLVEKAFSLGVDFMVCDPEMEWAYQPGRRDDPAGDADRFLTEMRRRFPVGKYAIGAANVPRVGGGFPRYPLIQMLPEFDFFLPQVYVTEWGIPEQVQAWTERSFGLNTDTGVPESMGHRPVYPTYDTCDNAGAACDAGFPQRAAAAARACGAEGVVFWAWHCTSAQGWDDLAAVAADFRDHPPTTTPPIPNPDPVPLPLPYNDSPNTAAWHCTATDVWVVQPEFLAFYVGLGARALELLGLPIRGQDGQVQYFERARLELQPDGTVLLGRLGALLLEATAPR